MSRRRLNQSMTPADSARIREICSELFAEAEKQGQVATPVALRKQAELAFLEERAGQLAPKEKGEKAWLT
jgi:hypothetical protein